MLREVNARELWQRILETRLQTGEPYILNIDAVNRALPKHQRELGLKVNTSNLCSEITLPTGMDHDGKERTAVCCLSSLNIETWDQWAENEGFVEDVLRMLDNVLTSFIETAPDSHAPRQVQRPARAFGGPGGDGLPFLPADEEHPAGKRHGQVVESAHLQEDTPGSGCGVLSSGRRTRRLPGRPGEGHEGALQPQAGDRPHRLASPSSAAAPRPASSRSRPMSIPTRRCRAPSRCAIPICRTCWKPRAQNTDATWQSIVEQEGSVQHLDCLSDEEKAVYRTAFEIDQRWIIELAADRTPYICQSQSLNLFLPADIDKWDLHMLHWTAWERGIKSLYYCRSKSISRAGFAGQLEKKETRSSRRAAAPITRNAWHVSERSRRCRSAHADRQRHGRAC